MSIKVRFTLRGKRQETTFYLVKRDDMSLPELIGQSDEHTVTLPLNVDNSRLSLKDISPIEDPKPIIDDKMLSLSEGYLEALASGDDLSLDDELISTTPLPGYGPEDIYVENKPFSLRQIVDLIETRDIDLTPNFQRNFVWDRTRQSQLIESILLGLPLPSIYLSQYDDGILTIVDGLQRINTIYRFMRDELTLTNLEYLKECNGLTYSKLITVLSPLRVRRFGQTQISCFVIDWRSPSQLKYDLFRRLNTGGKPLNKQEIRNCLSRNEVREALISMVSSDAFAKATAGSISDLRLEAQEAALKFLYFHEQYIASDGIGDYNGSMDQTLNQYVDHLNHRKDFAREIHAYTQALTSAYYLFGDYTFRKIQREYQSRRRPQINKTLMLAITVLLADVSPRQVENIYRPQQLADPLAQLISDDTTFFDSITYSTNSKAKIATVLHTLKTRIFGQLFQALAIPTASDTIPT